MREKNKKVGYSCYEKKMRGFEKPKEKYKRWRRNIKFAYQRVRYGYCDSDIWSIDYWFLNVMPGMLQQLKETTHSYPCFQGSMSHAVYGTAVSEEDDDAGMKQWNDILSEMIFRLKEANEDTCTRVNKYQKEYDKALKSLSQSRSMLEYLKSISGQDSPYKLSLSKYVAYEYTIKYKTKSGSGVAKAKYDKDYRLTGFKLDDGPWEPLEGFFSIPGYYEHL